MPYFTSFKYNFKTLLAKTFISLLGRFSLKTCHRIGSLIGLLYYLIPNQSRVVTETNIRLCFPQLTIAQQHKITRQTLIETGKTLTEASPMWQWDKNKLFSLIKQVHAEKFIQNALTKNNGVILALPHIGNWELLALYASSRYATTTMYRIPRMAQLDAIIKLGRERFGAKLVATDNRGIRALYKALQNNEIICILPDQEPGNEKGSGVFVPFFGIPAYSMTLASRLARKTQATILIAYCKRLADGLGYEIFFSALPENLNNISLEDSVARLNSGIEKSIREIPEQYQWGYKRFRTRPAKKEGNNAEQDFYNV